MMAANTDVLEAPSETGWVTEFAMVRVVRAPGERNGQLVLRIEVSSDGGETWKQLPVASDRGGIALRSESGHLTCVETAIAIADYFGGSIDLDRIGTV